MVFVHKIITLQANFFLQNQHQAPAGTVNLELFTLQKRNVMVFAHTRRHHAHLTTFREAELKNNSLLHFFCIEVNKVNSPSFLLLLL